MVQGIIGEEVVSDSQPVRRDDNEPFGDPAKGNEALLQDIREDFVYFRDFWRENHSEMRIDLRFISGDPWEPADRAFREDNKRPVLCPDELSQYQNATINNLRQNKRAIQVNPKGDGATDQDAERRSAIIKGIEYKSNAQAHYTNAFENQINCGMGFFRVTTKVVGKDDEQEPRIKGIENPLSVLLDPNAKEPDFSDMKRCFVLDTIRKRDFVRMYPKASKQSFAADDIAAAPDWFQAENMLVAEYWRIDDYKDDGSGGKVTQYITNGVEILETNKWMGSWIPIIAAMGKKVYVPSGSEMKRYYYSQIRLARGPQMMLAYIASQEAEEYGMAPRAPFVGYVGQFETDKAAWDTLNSVPRAYVQVDPTVDAASGSLLPLPSRPAFIPNAQAYEIGKESWRRSIQASMGSSPLPTSAQRQNEKSGIALDRIQTAQAIGSFHYTDNFDRAIENGGRQINELITLLMDTERDVTARQPDDSHSIMKVMPGGADQTNPGQQPVNPEDVFDPKKGDFDVTISSGMSYQSQRQQGSDFADKLLEQLNELPIPPQAKAQVVALSIKLKDIGPIGDKLSDIISPEQQGQVPPEAQQAMGKMQQEIQQYQAALAQAGKEIQDLQFDKKAGLAKHDGDMELQRLKIEGELTVAEISTKAQVLTERIEFIHDMIKQFHDQAHDSAMAAQGAQHAQDQQEQAGQQQQDLTAQQGDQQAQLQAQQQEAQSNDGASQ